MRNVTNDAPAGGKVAAKGARGFSLVEVMVAITIIGVGVLSMASLFPLSMRKVTRGDLESRATFHAQAKLEELKRTSWNQLVTSAAADTIEASFVRSWTIQENAPATGMKTVSVDVTWSDGKGPRTVLLSCYLSDSGM